MQNTDNVPAAIVNRVILLNGNFDLPPATVEAMKKVREILSRAAAEVADVITHQAPKYDVGRCIAMVDLMQSAKDVGCQALILPFAPGPPTKDH